MLASTFIKVYKNNLPMSMYWAWARERIKNNFKFVFTSDRDYSGARKVDTRLEQELFNKMRKAVAVKGAMGTQRKVVAARKRAASAQPITVDKILPAHRSTIIFNPEELYDVQNEARENDNGRTKNT